MLENEDGSVLLHVLGEGVVLGLGFHSVWKHRERRERAFLSIQT